MFSPPDVSVFPRILTHLWTCGSVYTWYYSVISAKAAHDWLPRSQHSLRYSKRSQARFAVQKSSEYIHAHRSPLLHSGISLCTHAFSVLLCMEFRASISDSSKKIILRSTLLCVLPLLKKRTKRTVFGHFGKFFPCPVVWSIHDVSCFMNVYRQNPKKNQATFTLLKEAAQ